MAGDMPTTAGPRGNVKMVIDGQAYEFPAGLTILEACQRVGIVVPPGEIYSFTEGGNGELGFYIVSNGSGQPWKCRVRPPCFANLAVLNKLLPGLFIADLVPTFGMINMIGGECDR